MLEPGRRGLASLETHGCVEEWIADKSAGYDLGRKEMGTRLANNQMSTYTHSLTKSLLSKKGIKLSHPRSAAGAWRPKSPFYLHWISHP